MLVAPPAIPDSVRRRVGYHHWKGGAIGTAVGAVGGLFLGMAAGGQCDDCSSTKPPLVVTTVAGAGLVGAFGFLVGLASPRYCWVHANE